MKTFANASACAICFGETRGQTGDWNLSLAHGSRALAVLRWSWLLSQTMEHGSGPVVRIGVRPDFLSWPLYGRALQSGHQHLDARGEPAGAPIVCLRQYRAHPRSAQYVRARNKTRFIYFASGPQRASFSTAAFASANDTP